MHSLHLKQDGEAGERRGAGLADGAGDAAGEEVERRPKLGLVVVLLRLRLLLLRRVPPRGDGGGAVHGRGGHPHARLRLHPRTPPPPVRRRLWGVGTGASDRIARRQGGRH